MGVCVCVGGGDRLEFVLAQLIYCGVNVSYLFSILNVQTDTQTHIHHKVYIKILAPTQLQWYSINPSMEFRCFVRDHTLIGVLHVCALVVHFAFFFLFG